MRVTHGCHEVHPNDFGQMKRRPRVEPTGDRAESKLLLKWPEREECERIRSPWIGIRILFSDGLGGCALGDLLRPSPPALAGYAPHGCVYVFTTLFDLLHV